MNKIIKFKKLRLNFSMKIKNNEIILILKYNIFKNKILYFELIESDLIKIMYLTIKINDKDVNIFDLNVIDHDKNDYGELDELISNNESQPLLYDYIIDEEKLKLKINKSYFQGDVNNIKYSNVYVLEKDDLSNYREVDNNIESNIVFCSMQDYYFKNH